MAITNKLTAIGDAIRVKTGGTTKLTLDQMVTEISGITGSGDTSIEDGLLSGALTLTTYSNDRVTKVGSYAFSGITALEYINLPNVTTIDGYAFKGCTGLREINFPLVTTITDRDAFSGCSKLTSVSLPLATNVGTYTFKDCPDLVSVNIPAATRLGTDMLRNCSSLTTVNLGSNITKIDMNVFAGCTSLRKLDIPPVTQVDSGAFSGCTSLTTIVFRNPDNLVALLGDPFTNTPIASGTGYIYVADDHIERYASYAIWTPYLSQLKPLSEYVEEGD